MKRFAAVFLALSLAACGEKKSDAAPAAGTKTDTGKPADTPKSPAPAPAAWSSVDKKGHDWASQMGSVKFDTDWLAAMARAKSSDKPILLLFTEKTTPDAAKIAAAFKDPKVVAATAEWVVALVDNDENGPLAERYGVKGVPMVVYATPAGEAVGATIGVGTDELLADMKSSLSSMKNQDDE